jgi:hypothetical protein
MPSLRLRLWGTGQDKSPVFNEEIARKKRKGWGAVDKETQGAYHP